MQQTEPALLSPVTTAVRQRLAVGWLVALIAANTVASTGLLGEIANHVSRGSGLTGSDFLSGWHLVLYGGVAAAALVIGALGVVEGPAAPYRLLPAAVAGLVVLCMGGATDAWWHRAWGVEASFDALVSPPHLLILTGLVLLTIAAIGAVAAEPGALLDWGRSAVVGASVLSLLTVVSLFTAYLSPLAAGTDLGGTDLSDVTSGEVTDLSATDLAATTGMVFEEPLLGTSTGDQETARGLASALWFSALVTLVVLVAQARGRTRPGTWTITFGILGLGPVIVNDTNTVPLTIGLLAFGVGADIVTLRARPHPLAFGAAVALMWAAYFATLSSRGDLIWDRELWAGVIATGLLAGAAAAGVVRWLTEARQAASPGARPLA
jgi:hypothetical protein